MADPLASRGAGTLEFLVDRASRLNPRLPTQPRPRPTARVLLTAADRASQTVRGISVLLAQTPALTADALPLARTLWELLLTMECICGDPEKADVVAFQYLAHAIKARRRAADVIRQLSRYPGLAASAVRVDETASSEEQTLRGWMAAHFRDSGMTPAEASAGVDGLFAHWEALWAKKREWNGLTIAGTAAAVTRDGADRAAEHKLYYPLLSQFAHSESLAAIRRFGAGTAADAEPLVHAAEIYAAGVLPGHWYLQMLDLVNQTLDFDWHERLVELHAAAKDQWRHIEARTRPQG